GVSLAVVAKKQAGNKRKGPAYRDGDRQREQNGQPLPERHVQEAGLGQEGGRLFLKPGKIQRNKNFRNEVARFARDEPDLAAAVVINTNQLDRKGTGAFAHSGQQFLVGRKTVVETALRIAAERVHGRSENFLIDDREKLCGEILLFIRPDATA